MFDLLHGFKEQAVAYNRTKCQHGCENLWHSRVLLVPPETHNVLIYRIPANKTLCSR